MRIQMAVVILVLLASPGCEPDEEIPVGDVEAPPDDADTTETHDIGDPDEDTFAADTRVPAPDTAAVDGTAVDLDVAPPVTDELALVALKGDERWAVNLRKTVQTVAVDNDGGVYFAAWGTSSSDGVLYKVDRDGAYVWTLKATSSEFELYRLVPLPGGGVLGVGWVGDGVAFGDSKPATYGFSDIALMTIQADGAMEVRTFGGSSVDWGTALALGDDGSVALGGFFDSSDLDFGAGALPHHGGETPTLDGYVVMFEPDGRVRWQVVLGGPGDDHIYDVVRDSSGSVYVTGSFAESLTIEDTTVTATPTEGANGFVASFSSTGALRWVRTFGGDFADVGYDLTVGADGTVVLAGEVAASAVFDDAGVFEVVSDPPHADGVLVAFSSDGEARWVVTHAERFHAVDVLPDGGYVVAGGALDAYLLTVDATGRVTSERSWVPASWEGLRPTSKSRDVAVVGNRVYLTGDYRRALGLNGATLEPFVDSSKGGFVLVLDL